MYNMKFNNLIFGIAIVLTVLFSISLIFLTCAASVALLKWVGVL